jgi:formyl-CoA transferase
LLVVDLSRVLAGPYAAMMLGDLGARVIKVERPAGGDDTRQWGPPFVGPEGATESAYFLSTNRNKESIVLDLKDAADLETLESLIVQADVLIENFRSGVMERVGLGWARLMDLNPRLVALSLTGFGTVGPDRHRVGYDQILQAEGGLMSFTGPSADVPTKVGVPIADLIAGMYGAYGVLAALRERDRSGLGQVVSTSFLAGQIAIHVFQGTRWLIAGEVPEPAGNHHPTVCPYGLFPTADSAIVIAVGNDAIWKRFAPLVGLRFDDPRFATNHDRVGSREELEAAVRTGLRSQGSATWLRAFDEAGVPAGEVKTLNRVYGSEQVRAEGLICEVTHPTLGLIQLPGPPLRFGRSPATVHRPPPTLGQHTKDIKESVRMSALRKSNARH